MNKKQMGQGSDTPAGGAEAESEESRSTRTHVKIERIILTMESELSRQTTHGQRFAKLLSPFVDFEPLWKRLSLVLNELPKIVQADFLNDPHFRISLDDCEPGTGRIVLMPSLNPKGSESRCVVLKERLASCDESFALYIIAHELAHAFLRNGGWGEIKDREDAADALAADWGFPRPQQPNSMWSIFGIDKS